MSKRWELDKEAFDGLLSWLDPDPEKAAQKYETIRAGLVKVLIHRQCSAAEDLADEIINRVAKKLPQIRNTFDGDPASYFYGVARNVFRENQRKARNLKPFDDQSHDILDPEPADELRNKCMDSCMKRLSPADRDFVVRYYEAATPEERDRLAESLGTTKATLAVRVYRIRVLLKKCFFRCMQEGNPVK